MSGAGPAPRAPGRAPRAVRLNVALEAALAPGSHSLGLLLRRVFEDQREGARGVQHDLPPCGEARHAPREVDVLDDLHVQTRILEHLGEKTIAREPEGTRGVGLRALGAPSRYRVLAVTTPLA